MSVSPDLAAATHGGDSVTHSNADLEALRELAAAAGFRLVPMSEGERAAATESDPETIAGKIKRAAWLKAAITAAEKQGKAYADELEELNRELAEQMVEEDVKRTTAGGWTAYFAPTYKLRKTSDEVTTEDILAALREAGHDRMVSEGYSYPGLQAYLKELHKEGLEVPEALAKVVKLETGQEVRMRRSGA